MKKWFLGICAAMMALAPGVSRAEESPAVESVEVAAPAKVVVIPIRAQIAQPELYILRRGLKQAIENGVQTIVLDMETPGGELGTTFEIVKALGKFPGKTVTYVNREAVSAGALIAAGTDEIYFSPDAVIGAAAPVMSGGGEIDVTMRAKIVSYLKARVRVMTEGKGYRGEVITAMIDSSHEFKIGDTVIKAKDEEPLSLTAQEAMKEYGDPAVPLLGAGIAPSLKDLLDQLHGGREYTVTRLEVTWSENLAQYLTSVAPILMGIGVLLVMIELKTPGFGVFGVLGGLLLAVFFFGHFTAGLSGHEPMLVFALGLALVVVEIFFFPGGFVFAVAGAALMLGSMVWSMADLWPDQPIAFTTEIFLGPLLSTLSGCLLAVIVFFLIVRFLPQGGLWGKMVLDTAVGGELGPTPALGEETAPVEDVVGRYGVASTPLFPSGQVQVGGKRYEARLSVGSADVGAPVLVVRQGRMGLEVELVKS